MPREHCFATALSNKKAECNYCHCSDRDCIGLALLLLTPFMVYLLLLVLLHGHMGQMLVVGDGGQVWLDYLVGQPTNSLHSVQGHEGCGEGSRAGVCTLSLYRRIDAQRVHELHQAVEVVLLRHHGARVDKVYESLHQARFGFRQNEADVLYAVQGRRLKEELEKGAGYCKEHLMRPDYPIFAIDCNIYKVLAVTKVFGLF